MFQALMLQRYDPGFVFKGFIVCWGSQGQQTQGLLCSTKRALWEEKRIWERLKTTGNVHWARTMCYTLSLHGSFDLHNNCIRQICSFPFTGEELRLREGKGPGWGHSAGKECSYCQASCTWVLAWSLPLISVKSLRRGFFPRGSGFPKTGH